MVTVDPTGENMIDYSDFQTQMVRAFVFLDTDGQPQDGASVKHQIEPLDGIGGLANNEVAELLYLQVDAIVSFRDDVEDQDVATVADNSGVVGINLSENDFIRSSTTSGDTTIIQEVGGGTVNAANSPNVTDNDRLEMFEAHAGAPFDDETNGTGGGYGLDAYHSEKYYRSTHGRGPVLDQTDDITILQEVTANDCIVPVEAEVRLTMFWDVAETSDAGRRFSVP